MSQDVLEFAKQVIEVEAAAVQQMVASLDGEFVRAVNLVLECRASLLTTGIGKAGIIARKLAATFASTGTPSHFLSAGDATHGDMGALREGDVVLILSASGESDEVLRLLDILKKLSHPVIAITSGPGSSLGRFATVVLSMGKIEEACPLGLAPSASTTAMLALGDALALTVMKLRDFKTEDFAVFHPAGQLGRKLIRVKEAMTFKRGENLPVASDALSVREVMHNASSIKRRPGAVILVDANDRISGLFTDADFRRLLTDDDGSALNKPISSVMTRKPRRVHAEALASEAMAIMRQMRIDELPVVGDGDIPLGMIDVQDLVVLRMFDIEPAV